MCDATGGDRGSPGGFDPHLVAMGRAVIASAVAGVWPRYGGHVRAGAGTSTQEEPT
ncbi:hypothetical protein AB0K60_18500 [Thermopolyspora sp. NPDC052614]|uniref:hypothetical protein n=1 Tax=Thermopolyspora sp. NPDC052614 TaxID=3155682 RepID=UPI0034347ED5